MKPLNKRYCNLLPGKGIYTLITILMLSIIITGCKKFVETESVTDKLAANQVFENNSSANAAIAGIYREEKNDLPISLTVYGSLSSNDVINFSPDLIFDDYSKDRIQVTNATLPWSSLYKVIYEANAAIEGLSVSTSLPQAARSYYLGEAKFNRAFCYFYLVNLFGDVPLITGTDVNANATASRSPSAKIYEQMISDLLDAQSKLGNDYSFTGGDRTRANKWVATALLARVYLYQKDWKDAEVQATAVINSGMYSLLSSPDGIFQQNNTEAIFQWANNSTENNAQIAGDFIFTTTPNIICSNDLVDSFEPGDKRKSSWLGSNSYLGNTYYYPYKFTNLTNSSTEWNTVIRLAELYLIRAEARTELGEDGAADDLNIIRERAGLPNTTAATQNEILAAIMHERRSELFTEDMHRWFDLKRTVTIDAVLGAERPETWKSTAALYPIPITEIQKDHNLTQNPGY